MRGRSALLSSFHKPGPKTIEPFIAFSVESGMLHQHAKGLRMDVPAAPLKPGRGSQGYGHAQRDFGDQERGAVLGWFEEVTAGGDGSEEPKQQRHRRQEQRDSV